MVMMTMGMRGDHAVAAPLGRQVRLGGPQMISASSDSDNHPCPGPNPANPPPSKLTSWISPAELVVKLTR